jgi:hypothetical protein
MLLKIAAAVAAVPLAGGAMVAATGVAMVDVRESGPRGHHIMVPVPLLAAEVAARFVPPRVLNHQLDRQLEHARPYLGAAQEMLEAVADGPDALLVEVEHRDEHVRISKAGDVLQIRVTGSHEEVSVDVPFAVAREALRQAQQGQISAGDLLAVLRRARFTKLVEVHDRGERVRITLW